MTSFVEDLVEPAKNWLKTRKVASLVPSEITIHLDQVDSVKMVSAGRVEHFRTAGYGGEIHQLAFFHSLVRPNDHLWDIGASNGLFALHAAAKGCTVDAFEPDPRIATRLRTNIELNNFDSKIEIHEVALSDEPGSFSLYSDGVEGNSPSLSDLGRHSSEIVVDVTTADLKMVDTKRPTIFKIDIEGAELDMLAGAKSILSTAERPRMIFVEIHHTFLAQRGQKASAVRELLADSGYGELTSDERGDQFLSIWVDPKQI